MEISFSFIITIRQQFTNNPLKLGRKKNINNLQFCILFSLLRQTLLLAQLCRERELLRTGRVQLSTSSVTLILIQDFSIVSGFFAQQFFPLAEADK